MILLVCLACFFGAFAHSGRTDANGGHRDNYNQSGLGSYHYHCGGYPAHLHTNGYCPYRSYSSSSYSSSSDDYDEGYEDGYDMGYDEGYNEGHKDGYDEGRDDGYDNGYDEGYKARIEEAAIEREKELNILIISILVIVAIVLLVKFIKNHREE